LRDRRRQTGDMKQFTSSVKQRGDAANQVNGRFDECCIPSRQKSTNVVFVMIQPLSNAFSTADNSRKLHRPLLRMIPVAYTRNRYESTTFTSTSRFLD